MFTLSWRKNLVLPYSLALVGFLILFSRVGSPVTFAQDDPIYLKQLHAIDTNDPGLLNPIGLAFSFKANVFFILETVSTNQVTIATMTPFENVVASLNVDVTKVEPLNLTFDNLANRLLLYDSGSSELVEIKTGTDGYLDPSPKAITRFQIGQLGLQKPRGMSIDPTNGHLFILDSAAPQIVRIEPDAQGGFDGAAALTEGRVFRVDLAPTGIVDPWGITLHPNNNHLYILSSVNQRVYKLTQTGQVMAILRFPSLPFFNPQGLIFALSADATDDPTDISLFVGDTGLIIGNPLEPELRRIIEFSQQIVYVPCPNHSSRNWPGRYR